MPECDIQYPYIQTCHTDCGVTHKYGLTLSNFQYFLKLACGMSAVKRLLEGNHSAVMVYIWKLTLYTVLEVNISSEAQTLRVCNILS